MPSRSCRPRHESAASTSVTKHGPGGSCLGHPELVTWTMASGSSVRSAGWVPSRPLPTAVRGAPAPMPAARQPTESVRSSFRMKEAGCQETYLTSSETRPATFPNGSRPCLLGDGNSWADTPHRKPAGRRVRPWRAAPLSPTWEPVGYPQSPSCAPPSPGPPSPHYY